MTLSTNEAFGYPEGFVSSFQYAPFSISAPSTRTAQSTFTVSQRRPIQVDPSGSDVIVLQIGSRYMKVGFANQAFGSAIPHVLALPTKDHSKQLFFKDSRNGWLLEAEQVQARLNQRHKQSRRKPPPNIYTSMTNYNRAVEYSEIVAHNDAIMLDWTEQPGRDAKFYDRIFVGTAALNLDPESAEYELRWPLHRGCFNPDYGHIRHVIGDLELLWMLAVERELAVTRNDFSKYSVLLVLPDSFGRAETRACIDALLGGQFPFRAATVMQASVAITGGVGVSSAVVIDCGAQSTSIACVDEGYLVPETRIKLGFGGDDVTRLLRCLLRVHAFPYPEVSENESLQWKPLDWILIESLKEQWCTLRESDIPQGPVVVEFYVRQPGKDTKQYRCKVLEEVILAPGALFEPEMAWISEMAECDDANNRQLFIDVADAEEGAEGPEQSEPALSTTMDAVPVDNEPSTALLPATPTYSCPKCTPSAFSASSIAILLEHVHAEHNGTQCVWCGHVEMDSELLDCHSLAEHVINASETPRLPVLEAATPLSMHYPSLPAPFAPCVPLDEAIHRSLLALADSEKAQRCLGSIVVVGGGALLPGLPEHVETTLAARLPLNPLTALTSPKLFPNTRDFDLRQVAWKGGAVAARLESTAEAWISAGEWRDCGQKAALTKDRIYYL